MSNFQSSSLCLVGFEAIDPAVAAAKDHLRHAAEDRHRGARPLAVQDVLAGRIIGPIDLARVLVHRHEAGSIGAGIVTVRFIDAVGVLTNRMSPQLVTEQLHMLCCEVSSLSIMSRTHTTSASSLSAGVMILKADSVGPTRAKIKSRS